MTSQSRIDALGALYNTVSILHISILTKGLWKWEPGFSHMFLLNIWKENNHEKKEMMTQVF